MVSGSASALPWPPIADVCVGWQPAARPSGHGQLWLSCTLYPRPCGPAALQGAAACCSPALMLHKRAHSLFMYAPPMQCVQNRTTPLLVASRQGHAPCVELLLGKGAKVDQAGEVGAGCGCLLPSPPHAASPSAQGGGGGPCYPPPFVHNCCLALHGRSYISLCADQLMCVNRGGRDELQHFWKSSYRPPQHQCDVDGDDAG
jgi:hypothetical protein